MRRLLLLDLDGTLVDTLSFIIQCFRQSVTPFTKQEPTQAEIVATFGPAEVECIERVLKRYDAEGLLREPFSMAQVYRAADRFHELYASGYGSNAVQAYPAMVDAVKQVRGWGWATAVFTGKGRTSAEETLRHLELTPLFDALVTSDDVKHPKPAPDGVLLACERTGVPTAQTIFVGDNPADIQSGNAAGAHSVAALWGAVYPEETRAASPKTILQQPEEIHSWLEQQR
jgi:HAD superfamily hydrolase (TIGR01509 family)